LGEAVHGNGIAGRLLRPAVNALVPARPTIITVLSGVAAGARMIIEPKSEKFYWTGAHEPAVQDQLLSSLKLGDVFWDLGAHIGFFTLIASRLVGPNGHVHAFEPHTENRGRLEQSLALNGTTNVSIHSEAFGSKPGPGRLRRSDSSLMWSLMSEKDTGDGELVECTTLDVMTERLGCPDMIKVDVEGAEWSVLQGGDSLLARNTVLIVVEFLSAASLDRAFEQWPAYQFAQLDDKNWVMSPKA
jgi:FkbM family methyltransferase